MNLRCDGCGKTKLDVRHRQDPQAAQGVVALIPLCDECGGVPQDKRVRYKCGMFAQMGDYVKGPAWIDVQKRTRFIVGTVVYVSPEICDPDLQIGAVFLRSDDVLAELTEPNNKRVIFHSHPHGCYAYGGSLPGVAKQFELVHRPEVV